MDIIQELEEEVFSGQGPNENRQDFANRKDAQRAALQNAENIQARDYGYNARENIANRTYGPLQKYTGERGFLGNLLRGANKYGYTDTYTSGPNQGQVKPGYGGRILGGIGSMLTGIPFVGGALGTAYDYGKGIFGRKPRDMSEFNRLGLGGIKPGTLDFDPDAKIQDTMFDQEFDINKNVSNVDNSYDDITNYRADVSQSDIDILGKYAPNQGLDLIRMVEPGLNRTISDQEIKDVLQKKITSPTGIFS